MHLNAIFAAAVTLTVAAASPLPPNQPSILRRSVKAATQAIIDAAPSTASCSGAEFPSECATAAQAAPAIIDAFVLYGISTPGEQAGLLSLMLFESGSFKYNVNHYPGVPGQGTRNMQSPAFNAKYAQYLVGKGALKAADLAAASTPDAVLKLLLGDEFSFASAAWFLATQCSQDARAQLQAGTQEGYTNYLTSCVGTSATADRLAGWQAALKVVS